MAGESGFNECLPAPGVPELGIIASLPRHGAEIQFPALADELRFVRRSYLKSLGLWRTRGLCLTQ